MKAFSKLVLLLGLLGACLPSACKTAETSPAASEIKAAGSEPFLLGVKITQVFFAGENWVQLKEVNSLSPADKAGLRDGDLVRRVNGVKVFTQDDFDHFLSQAIASGSIQIGYRRFFNGQQQDGESAVIPVNHDGGGNGGGGNGGGGGNFAGTESYLGCFGLSLESAIGSGIAGLDGQVDRMCMQRVNGSTFKAVFYKGGAVAKTFAALHGPNDQGTYLDFQQPGFAMTWGENGVPALDIASPVWSVGASSGVVYYLATPQ
jgi:hypothetical protein